MCLRRLITVVIAAAWLGGLGCGEAIAQRTKMLEFGPDAKHLAVGDYIRSMCVISTAVVTETMRMRHPHTVVPRDSLAVCLRDNKGYMSTTA